MPNSSMQAQKVKPQGEKLAHSRYLEIHVLDTAALIS
jgi:hypothetical protein